jgi:hypothetical protein
MMWPWRQGRRRLHRYSRLYCWCERIAWRWRIARLGADLPTAILHFVRGYR